MCYILDSFPLLSQFQSDLFTKISVTEFFDKSTNVYVHVNMNLKQKSLNFFCPSFSLSGHKEAALLKNCSPFSLLYLEKKGGDVCRIRIPVKLVN